MRKWGGGAHAFGILGILGISGPISAVFLEAYNRISWKVLYNSMDVGIDAKGLTAQNPFLFGAAFNMALCFPEVIVLSLFALCAYFFGNIVFPVIFLSAVGGIFLSVKYFRK